MGSDFFQSLPIFLFEGNVWAKERRLRVVVRAQ